jgi:3-dehydroquinate dehydratase/shikimate dehydrogenase
MSRLMELHTERLRLRPWRDSDWEPFARLNADRRVMEYFAATLTTDESHQLARRIQDHIEQEG